VSSRKRNGLPVQPHRHGGEDVAGERQGDNVRYPAWSPSGDFIVYERAEITGNIWTTELPPVRSGRAGIW